MKNFDPFDTSVTMRIKSSLNHFVKFILISSFSISIATCPSCSPTLPVYNGDLFDAHMHLFPNIDIVNIAQNHGINSGMLLFSSLNNADDVLNLMQSSPAYVSGGAGIGRDPNNSNTSYVDNTTVSDLTSQLDNGMLALGELSLHHNPFPVSPNGDNIAVDSPIMLEVFDLAADPIYDVPVCMHIEYEFISELQSALSQKPETKMVWVHAGDAPADIVNSIMTTYSNLYIDISVRNPFWERNGRTLEEQTLTVSTIDWTIKDEWKKLFEKFPNRVLFGTDAGSTDRNNDLSNLIIYYRTVLGQLSESTAKKIAYENIKTLLKL